MGGGGGPGGGGGGGGIGILALLAVGTAFSPFHFAALGHSYTRFLDLDGEMMQRVAQCS